MRGLRAASSAGGGAVGCLVEHPSLAFERLVGTENEAVRVAAPDREGLLGGKAPGEPGGIETLPCGRRLDGAFVDAGRFGRDAQSDPFEKHAPGRARGGEEQRGAAAPKRGASGHPRRR